jgi:8-oxoguanine DNA-glycosylase Ogg
MAALRTEDAWKALRVCPDELRLDVTLPTGQSFRWARGAGGDYAGVVGNRAFALRSVDGDVLFRVVAPHCGEPLGDAEAALRDYLGLSTPLQPLHAAFAAADARFAALLPHVRGARVLRQPPVECLFSFICSSNNNVKRIGGMVERLCESYGERLTPPPPDAAAASPSPGESPAFFAFPTLAALAAADETRLRELGFGYRAPFITGAARLLQSRPGGGEAWLESLRGDGVSAAEAVAQLSTLPGVGPKVAACAALFSLDKRDCVPVDTHVYQLCVAHYGLPACSAASLTPRVAAACQAQLRALYGPHAGWAHTALFVAELRELRAALPPELRTPPGLQPGAAARRAKKEAQAATHAAASAGGGRKRKLPLEVPPADEAQTQDEKS